jgi:hypothetical protein
LVEIDGAVEDAVVGDGEGAKFEFVRAVHEFVQAAGRIEQRILGVEMEVDEIGVRRHADNLRRGAEAAQEEQMRRRFVVQV